MKFEVGNTVEWTSQANGRHITKRGVIVSTIPANTRPIKSRALQKAREGAGKLGLDKPGIVARTDFGGMARNHESYVVLVPTDNPNRSSRLYWPRVNALVFIKEPDGEEAA